MSNTMDRDPAGLGGTGCVYPQLRHSVFGKEVDGTRETCPNQIIHQHQCQDSNLGLLHSKTDRLTKTPHHSKAGVGRKGRCLFPAAAPHLISSPINMHRMNQLPRQNSVWTANRLSVVKSLPSLRETLSLTRQLSKDIQTSFSRKDGRTMQAGGGSVPKRKSLPLGSVHMDVCLHTNRKQHIKRGILWLFCKYPNRST